MDSEKKRMVVIAVDASELAERAFDCKFVLFCLVHVLAGVY